MDRYSQEGLSALIAPTNGRSGVPIYRGRLTSRKSLQILRQDEGEEEEEATTGQDANPNGRGVPPASPSPTSSSSSSRLASPLMRSRIPRPSSRNSMSNARRPLPLAEAFRMAEAEEKAIASRSVSPSPGPRPWRYSSEPGANGIQNFLSNRPFDLSRRRSSRQSNGSGRDDNESLMSNESIEERARSGARDLIRLDSDRDRIEGVLRSGNGLFSNKTRLGPKVAETGRQLNRKASNSSLDGTSSSLRAPRSWGVLGKTDPNFARRLMGSPDPPELRGGDNVSPPPSLDGQTKTAKDGPIPSIEQIPTPGKEVTSPDFRPGTAAPLTERSPNKSFAWQAEADFTAGDIQVSASPPVKVSTRRSKLDELKDFRPRNTKLDDILRREIEAANMYPDEPALPEPEEAAREPSKRGAENDKKPGRDRLVERTNTKIDDIRAREIESLSRRALATARLDEIKERNSESQSLSPEATRKPSLEPTKDILPTPAETLGPTLAPAPTPALEPAPDAGLVPEPTTLQEEDEGERIPNTPVIVFRSASGHERRNSTVSAAAEVNKDLKEPSDSRRRPSQSGEDAQDLLRRLARAASSSPSLEQQASRGRTSEDRLKETVEAVHLRGDNTPEEGKKDEEKPAQESTEEPKLLEKQRPRPSDELRGRIGSPLRGVASSDSEGLSTKRSSMANSEADPTDRIAAEMMLFAPLENQSERGSIRAPSPSPDADRDDEEDEVEETPKAVRRDPPSMPTPKVTGAYVETPATAKVDKPDVVTEPQDPKQTAAAGPSSILRATSILRSRGRPKSALVNGRAADNDGSGTSTSVAPRRRAKSLPRAKSPLVNSVKLPSARDDLLEIQRMHQVEDSTLDDLDELFAKHDIEDTLNLGEILKEAAGKATRADHAGIERPDANFSHSLVADPEKELQGVDRALLGVKMAKRGIEVLEDQVSQSGNIPNPRSHSRSNSYSHHQDSHHLQSSSSNLNHSAVCPLCIAAAATTADDNKTKPAVTYVHLAVPKLYHRQPRFRLSILGMLLLLLGLWYVAESTMCSRYCRPASCTSGSAAGDCNWSPQDPLSFGHAIPVKLDQWSMGGRGRALIETLSQEVGDLWADLVDSITGTDPSTVDVRYLDHEQRRRHRRRMVKKGLLKPWDGGALSEQQRENMRAWARARLERERAEGAREMGYDVGDGLGGESMAGDQRVG